MAGRSSGVISNGAVADEVIRDDAVHDGEPPLKVLGKKVMYQEQGGADFAVTQVALEDVCDRESFRRALCFGQGCSSWGSMRRGA